MASDCTSQKRAMNTGKEPVHAWQLSSESSCTTGLPKNARSLHNKKSARIAKKVPKKKFAPSTSKNTLKKGASSSKRKSDWDTYDDDEWTRKIQFCPTFRPSVKEFEDPYAYIDKIAPKASKYGMCKIVSPLSLVERPASVLKDLKFKAEYIYLNTKFRGEAQFAKRLYDIDAFENMADKDYQRKYEMPASYNTSKVEKDIWKKIDGDSKVAVEYANGLEVSAFSSDRDDPLGSSNWNLQKFAHHPESATRHLRPKIIGKETKKKIDLRESKIYIGKLYSYDFWHAEPGFLNRIEYHHYGAPKTWYGVPSKYAVNFENVVKEFVLPKIEFEMYEAYDVLNLKAMVFSPKILWEKSVPVYKAEQNPGEFIVTFPKAYHTGFSNGFTCTEAVNFATRDWFPFGAEASERLALYARETAIPYQKLLCKEGETLYYNKIREIHSPSYRDLKLYLVCLIRFHHFAFEEIRKSGTKVKSAPYNDKFKYCFRCHRECYLAYVQCICYPRPTCIFHDIYLGCRHKGKRVVWVNEDILDFHHIAKRFEEEEDAKFLKEVKRLLEKLGPVIGCLPSMNPERELDELIDEESTEEEPIDEPEL